MRYDHLVDQAVEAMRQAGETTPSVEHIAQAAAFGASVSTFEADCADLQREHIREAQLSNHELPLN